MYKCVCGNFSTSLSSPAHPPSERDGGKKSNKYNTRASAYYFQHPPVAPAAPWCLVVQTTRGGLAYYYYILYYNIINTMFYYTSRVRATEDVFNIYYYHRYCYCCSRTCCAQESFEFPVQKLVGIARVLEWNTPRQICNPEFGYKTTLYKYY